MKLLSLILLLRIAWAQCHGYCPVKDDLPLCHQAAAKYEYHGRYRSFTLYSATRGQSSANTTCAATYSCDSAANYVERSGGWLTNQFNLMAEFGDKTAICSRQAGPNCMLRFVVSSDCEVKNEGGPLPDKNEPLERTVGICNTLFNIPAYDSYNGNNKASNEYSPYYTYRQNSAIASGRFSFELLKTPSDPGNTKFETEHIYEVQLLWKFLLWFAGPAGDPAMVEARKKWDGPISQWTDDLVRVCRNAYIPYLLDYWPSATSRPKMVEKLTATLPGRTARAPHNMNEFVYLETTLNGLKQVLFNQRLPHIEPTWDGKLKQLAKAGLLFRYMADVDVQRIWKSTSNRVQSFYSEMDVNGQQTTGLAKDLRWESRYELFPGRLAVHLTGSWRAFRDRVLAQAKQQMKSDPALASSVRNALFSAIDAECSGDGLLGDQTWTLELPN